MHRFSPRSRTRRVAARTADSMIRVSAGKFIWRIVNDSRRESEEIFEIPEEIIESVAFYGYFTQKAHLHAYIVFRGHLYKGGYVANSASNAPVGVNSLQLEIVSSLRAGHLATI